jgi:hypothetical protein
MLKKTALIAFLIMAFASYVFAADVVHLKNGTKYEGKVVAIHPDTIEMSMGEGRPTRFIAIKDIRVIVYENGETEAFQDTVTVGSTEKELKEIKAKLAVNEKESAKSNGVLLGVGICVALFLVLSLIASSGS